MTECSRCGDCCDPVTLSAEMQAKIHAQAVADLRDPDTNPEWWLATHDMSGPTAWDDARSIWTSHREAVWLEVHWTVVATTSHGSHLRCDQFDIDTRLCTAHDDRPAICRGFPWYGRAPSSEPGPLPLRCSFTADLPEAQRPEGWVSVEIGSRA
jgi:Fe-S-cluster containining protein